MRQGGSGQGDAPGEKWEFELVGDPWSAPRWDVSGDSLSFTDEDRRQWKRRLPMLVVADHLTAEPAFHAMLGRVRASTDPGAAWAEAGCFRLRGGAKGGRRALMVRLLETAAASAPGGEERAMQALLPGGWTSPEEQTGRRAAYQSQDRYLARLWIGAQVLACRAAGRCVECHLTDSIDSPTLAGDYCRKHRADVDHAGLADHERRRREALRCDKAWHRKAVEHLFIELAAAFPAGGRGA